MLLVIPKMHLGQYFIYICNNIRFCLASVSASVLYCVLGFQAASWHLVDGDNDTTIERLLGAQNVLLITKIYFVDAE